MVLNALLGLQFYTVRLCSTLDNFVFVKSCEFICYCYPLLQVVLIIKKSICSVMPRQHLIKAVYVIWLPYTLQDIEAVECVQRHFTKRLSGLNKLSYQERLKYLGLPSLELRRLHWCYKIVLGLVGLQFDDFFKLSSNTHTGGHRYKMTKNYTSARVRSSIFVIVLSVSRITCHLLSLILVHSLTSSEISNPLILLRS